jgi:hypothetical protein
MTTRTHIFIDYENVQPSPQEFARVPKSDVHVWLLHGAHQHDFAADLVREWLPIGGRMQILQSNKTGKNAVDVLLAMHLGKAQQQDLQAGRSARYVIVSRDNDYNALQQHQSKAGTALHRKPTLTAALELIKPVAKPKPAVPLRATPLPEDIALAVENLRKNAKSRPTRRPRLEGYIGSMMRGKVTQAAGLSIIQELEKRDMVVFDGLKVAYKLDGGNARE